MVNPVESNQSWASDDTASQPGTHQVKNDCLFVVDCRVDWVVANGNIPKSKNILKKREIVLPPRLQSFFSLPYVNKKICNSGVENVLSEQKILPTCGFGESV